MSNTSHFNRRIRTISKGRPLWAAIAWMVLIAVQPSAHAQGRACTIDFLGRPYDVFTFAATHLSTGGLSNATQVLNPPFDPIMSSFAVGQAAVSEGGDPRPVASFFSAEGSGKLVGFDVEERTLSYATGVSPDGSKVVGTLGVTGTNGFRKTFVYFTDTADMKFLEDEFPAIADLADNRFLEEGSPTGITPRAINDSGTVLFSAVANDGEGDVNLYTVTSDGGLSLVSPQNRLARSLNSGGQAPPAGSSAINDFGDHAGQSGDAAGVFATLNGSRLPNSSGAMATDINNSSYVAAHPGLIWTPSGDRVDLREELIAQCGEWLDSRLPDGRDGLREFKGDTFINDQNHVFWVGGRGFGETIGLLLKPACPTIAISAASTSGFTLVDGRFQADIGTRFQVRTEIRNTGRGPLENVRVRVPRTADGIPYLRQIGPQLPPIPESIEPGETFESFAEWEAAIPGEFESSPSILTGTGGCGPIELQSASFSVRVATPGDVALTITLPRVLTLGEAFNARITASLGVNEPRIVNFEGPLLAEVSEGSAILEIGDVETPAPFTLTPLNRSRSFIVAVKPLLGGSTSILTRARSDAPDGGELEEIEASTPLLISPFAITTSVSPSNLLLNQTANSDLGPRCQAYNAERALAGLPQKPNCIEIEMQVKNMGNETVENLNIPGGLQVLSFVTSSDLNDPRVPLFPIRYYPPEGPTVDLTNPGNATPGEFTLPPGETATFAWLVDAFDRDPTFGVDNSTDLSFGASVVGNISNQSVDGIGTASFKIVDKPLLEWGVLPTNMRTNYLSGHAVQLDGRIENISAKDGAPGRELIVAVHQFHDGNVGGGYLFKDSERGSRTPNSVQYYRLPPEGEGKSLKLAAVFKSIPAVENTTGEVKCFVKVWTIEDDDTLTPADSQVIVKEGWKESFKVTFRANRPVFSMRQQCINQLGISPFLCGLNQGLVFDFSDGMIGLGKWLFKAGKDLSWAGVSIVSYDLWVKAQVWKAVLGNDEAYNSLMREAYLQYTTLVNLGVMAGEAGSRAPMVFDAFATKAGDTMSSFFRAVEEGNTEELQFQVGKFLGSNPDIVFEPLVAGYLAQRLAAKLEAEVAGDVVQAAIRDANDVRRSESVTERVAAAELDPNVTSLAKVLEPGDVLDLTLLRKIYGVGKEQLEHLRKIARDNGVVITFRPRSPISLDLLKRNLAWPKPQALKFKTVNKIDTDYLGYPPGSNAKIRVIEPPAGIRGITDEVQLTDAVNNYMDALRRQRPELADNTVLFGEVKQRLRTRAKEWNKLTDELKLKDTPEPSDIQIKTNFGVADQQPPGLVRDVMPDIGANDVRTVRSTRVDNTVDPVTGGQRKVWEVNMNERPGGTDFRDVTGDVDFMAILEPSGGFIRNPFRRRKIYAQLADVLDMQHGESFAFWKQQLRVDFLRGNSIGGDAMVAISPYGRQQPTAAKFVERLSVMNTSENARFLPTRRQVVVDSGADATSRANQIIEARRADPTGEFVLVAGADLNSKINLNFVNRFQAIILERALSRWYTLRYFLFPRIISELLDRPQEDARFSREPDAPILQGEPDDGRGMPTFRVWEEGTGWREITPVEAVTYGDSTLVDMAPMTTLPEGASRGDHVVQITAKADLGIPGDFIEVGDRVVINPGGVNEEYATVTGEGSLVFASSLKHDHMAGEIVVSLGPANGDRDGDGLSATQELTIGTDPDRADTDGDGFDDGVEVSRMTDPLDPASGMFIGGLRLLPESLQTELAFVGAPGRRYAIERSGNLSSWSWKTVNTVTAPDSMLGTFVFPMSNTPQRFYRLRLVPDDDLDDDGLSVAEELTAGTDPNLSDSDGDGLSDGVELSMGTDPLDALSNMAITDIIPFEDGSHWIEFSSVPGLRYVVEHSTSMDEMGWREVTTTFADNGRTAVVAPGTGGGESFFRVRWLND